MRLGFVAAAITAIVPFVLTGETVAQQAPQFPNMTFFITSVSGPKGADFGGIEGADRHCQTLAARAGAGSKTWRAYLSVQAIGRRGRDQCARPGRQGPLGQCHRRAGCVQRRRSAFGQQQDRQRYRLDRNGPARPGAGFIGNMHDVLTGSTAEGQAPPADKDLTCGNWTKSGEGAAMVGHADRKGLRYDIGSISWNAAHPSRGCSPDALKSSGGAGLLYCFAAN